MLKLIMQAIVNQLDLNDVERRNVEKHNCSHETKIIEFLVDFFNNRHDLKLRRHQHAPRASDKRKKQLFLLCLDNASTLIEHDKEFEFINFLAHLEENCSSLRIIITTSRSLSVQKFLRTQPLLLQQLQSTESVKLFLDNCEQNLDWKEIYELILLDENYAYNQVLPTMRDKKPPFEVTESLKKELKIQARLSMYWSNLLAHHDMFSNMLLGNPTSITMVAKIHQNPMNKRSLAQMYKSLKAEKKLKVEHTNFDYNGKPMPI